MRGKRLLILTYHRVLDRPDPMRPDDVVAGTFDLHMRLLSQFCHVLPLAEAIEKLRAGLLPRRAMCITFDDGYADNHDVALPILRRWRLPATFFIATGFIRGQRMWNDTVIESLRVAPGPLLDIQRLKLGTYAIDSPGRRMMAAADLLRKLKYLPMIERQQIVNAVADQTGLPCSGSLMMTPEQIRNLSANGMEIGGHTVNHPILMRCDAATAWTEIKQGKDDLEGIVGKPMRLFAYPNGKPNQDYGPQHVHMIREAGFNAAVSTLRGLARTGSDIYQLPRFSPWDVRPGRFLFRLFQQWLLPPESPTVLRR
jgi:peptidoglycan/xylan/chitin deacetylase (PgdA/CDA1 family)